MTRKIRYRWLFKISGFSIWVKEKLTKGHLKTKSDFIPAINNSNYADMFKRIVINELEIKNFKYKEKKSIKGRESH